MDAVEYIKEAKRICKSRSICKSVSGKCPLLDENGHCTATTDICAADVIEKTEKAVQIVEQWAKEHPIKTRQSELLKLFPNTKIDSGVIIFCPRNFLPEAEKSAYCKKHESCKECRKNYWLTEVTDND